MSVLLYAAGRSPSEIRRATTAYRALVTEFDEHWSLWDLQRELLRQVCSLMQFELDKESRARE